MVAIDPKDKKYIITFKRKDLRPNQRDDKFELFRQIVGLEDVRDIVDISHFKGNHMHEPINKTIYSVTDINSYETPFIMAKLSSDQVGRLRRDPNVEFVEEEVIRKITEEFPGWQVFKLKASDAWIPPLGVTGSGVNVAIIDTGVDPHLDFGGNLKINQNFTTESGNGPSDPAHHGTHVAGICGAAKDNNEGIQGIAPNCNIWNIKAGMGNQGFTSSDVVEAFVYCSQNNAHVMNMSFAGTINSQAEQNALTTAFNKSIFLVAGAGNTGRQESAIYPAAYTGVIAITNLQENNRLSTGPTGSSTGTYVDLTAPGTNIQSLAENNLYRVLTGTSMSSPAVSGVVALAFSAYRDTGCPPYTPGAPKHLVIQNVMADTASKAGLENAGPAGQKDVLYGYGLPNARNIVASLKGALLSSLP